MLAHGTKSGRQLGWHGWIGQRSLSMLYGYVFLLIPMRFLLMYFAFFNLKSDYFLFVTLSPIKDPYFLFIPSSVPSSVCLHPCLLIHHPFDSFPSLAFVTYSNHLPFHHPVPSPVSTYDSPGFVQPPTLFLSFLPPSQPSIWGKVPTWNIICPYPSQMLPRNPLSSSSFCLKISTSAELCLHLFSLFPF